MSLTFPNPQQTIQDAVLFLQNTFSAQKKMHAVIAVSGGIDSALSLTLVVKALGAEHVTPVLLPYADQNMEDARAIIAFNQIPESQIIKINIQSMADEFLRALAVPSDTSAAVRRGNIQARCRMICVYDVAKKLDALVIGTENKSEHYLGYFTRFGDAASDIEPICNLYKTQVRQLAAEIGIPATILQKAPSAGLWSGQTDEAEMGFTYQEADEVLFQLIDQQKSAEEIQVNISAATIQKIAARVEAMKFKWEVPYLPM